MNDVLFNVNQLFNRVLIRLKKEEDFLIMSKVSSMSIMVIAINPINKNTARLDRNAGMKGTPFDLM